MVLPATWSAILTLLAFSIACFALWPNLFKIAGKWRFELFSLDFALGALVCGLIAAYTLGTLGSALDFSDSLLVAGRRAELMAVLAGGVFAFGNILYLAAISFIGVSNATLVSFGVLGCTVSVLELVRGSLVTAGIAFLLLVLAIVLAVAAANAKRPVNQSQTQQPPPNSSKGVITGVLAGFTFAAVLPVLKMAEGEELGVGAYGGILLATVGIFVFTLIYSLFFINVSLEGGVLRYSSYLSGTSKSHLAGVLCGFVWAAGALALYVACTSAMGITRFHAWTSPFAGALLAALSGLVFRQKIPQPARVRNNTFISTLLFAAGLAVLLLGMR